MRLTIDNSECKLEGLSIEGHKKLKELLSYSLDPQASYFSGGYGPKRVSLLTKTGTFPSGLLYIVEKFLRDNNLKVFRVDNRQLPIALESFPKISLGVEPYPEQKAAAEAAKRFKQGIITAPTGTGKSLICALIINELKVKTLVVVPSLELKRQLTEDLKAKFGSDSVGQGKLIWVQNVDSLDPSDDKHGYNAVIIDEFHHSGAKTYRKLNKKAWSNVYYKLGLTATPFRSQDNERLLLESVLSQVIYRINYADAVANGYIVPMEAYYIELPKVKCSSTSWPDVYSKLVVNNEVRNQVIAGILKNLDSQDTSALCLVKEIKHGEILKQLTNGFFANGQDADTPSLIKLFNQRKLNCLIGTTGVLGEGVDSRPAEYIIIAGLGKSKNSLMQQFGRGFRKYGDKQSCKIILFLDKSHKWTKEHFKAQLKILQDEYGVTPMELKYEMG